MQSLYDLRAHPNTPPNEMDRRYAEAFRGLGMDIDTTDPGEIGRRVRAAGGASMELLILALDDWSMRFKAEGREGPPPRGGPLGPGPRPDGPPRPDGRREEGQNPERRKRILEASIASEDHPWRNRLRRAILDKDRATLDQLAASIETENPPVMSIVLPSNAMSRGEEAEEPALEVLLKAYRLHPSDFWICFFIANGNILYTDARRMELSERHARLAVSLNPKAAHAYGLLGAALLRRGRPGDREEALRLLESRPGSKRGGTATP